MTNSGTALLVTGASGFVGRRVSSLAQVRGHRVVTVDHRPGAAPKSSRHIVLDVRDGPGLAEVMLAEEVGVVVHAAAVVGVDAVRSEAVVSTSVNVVGAATVLDAALRSGVGRLVDLSSEEVYGAVDAWPPTPETACLRPTSLYGVQKAAAEGLGLHYQRQGLAYVAARLSWVYGAEFPRTRPPVGWCRDAAAGRRSEASPGGRHAADLIHVDDAATAILALVEARTLQQPAYNVASGVGTTLDEVRLILRGLVPAWDVDLAPGPLPGTASRGALDVQSIRAELGWTADLSLEDGLRRTLHGR